MDQPIGKSALKTLFERMSVMTERNPRMVWCPRKHQPGEQWLHTDGNRGNVIVVSEELALQPVSFVHSVLQQTLSYY